MHESCPIHPRTECTKVLVSLVTLTITTTSRKSSKWSFEAKLYTLAPFDLFSSLNLICSSVGHVFSVLPLFLLLRLSSHTLLMFIGLSFLSLYISFHPAITEDWWNAAFWDDLAVLASLPWYISRVLCWNRASGCSRWWYSCPVYIPCDWPHARQQDLWTSKRYVSLKELYR